MTPHLPHTVIIIAGPTAVGKTALAIQLALHFNTSIISADSRQCFKELNIGVAKPTLQELNTVSHYFIGTHSIEEEVNAGIFEKYALEVAATIFQQHPIAIMVGGTGLYIKAFTEGIDAMPSIPDTLRATIIQQYEQQGLGWLQEQVQAQDPIFWQQAEKQNPQRLMRALEITIATGKSITQFRSQQTANRPFDIIKVGIEMPREQLVNRIIHRIDMMVNDGLVAEAEALLPFQHLNALQTVGYKELFAYFNQQCTLPEAINQIKTNTRQYAKRQMTWFKKDKSFQWFMQSPNLLEDVMGYLETFDYM
ncbi:tRNA (adenosine(37)-N6)-dimethylallyltransferase MiaA [Parasediminibacterium sp. JCM 36343]|uniref:tRNA (adenosine(37)-N6)-dimethylallyltransferase MiaA n=1 Tax=Parasediminibacterium sp. JCM 36343 TaxID=3374279 RepID=UPI00397B9710